MGWLGFLKLNKFVSNKAYTKVFSGLPCFLAFAQQKMQVTKSTEKVRKWTLASDQLHFSDDAQKELVEQLGLQFAGVCFGMKLVVSFTWWLGYFPSLCAAGFAPCVVFAFEVWDLDCALVVSLFF